MLIRKNTKAFKTILEIVSACQSRADREQLIRVYITKAGSSVKDRISVEAIQGDSALFYEMNYQTVLNSLRSSNHQLNESDEFPGVYYFHSTSNKQWDETPFEFDETVKKEFSNLPDLPHVRKKEKSEKYVLPSAETKPKTKSGKADKVVKPAVKKVVDRGPKQPDFKLKHKIEFTNLDKIIFRQPLLTKENILSYYNDIAAYILPHVKDRMQWVRTHADSTKPLLHLTEETIFGHDEDSIPEWIATRSAKKASTTDGLLTNDKEHLLLFAERGVLEFHPEHSKSKQREYPDHLIITIESPDSDIAKSVDVALASKEIFDGLKLPAFVKTYGTSELHIYIPLDAKSDFADSCDSAVYLCKLINLKIPDLVAIAGSEQNDYKKVVIDSSLNEEGQTIAAPYSLIAGESVTISTPLSWNELDGDLKPEEFNPESIVKRLKKNGDPFENLYKKKVNAEELKILLEERYSFLF